MRLIDVDEITDKEIVEYLGRAFASCAEDVRCLLDDQPTAFDEDKAIEQIKDHAIEFETFGISSDYVELNHVIEIVKGDRIEDTEEQGTLVKLPCKVGDSVFIIVGKDISKQKVKEIRIFDNRIEFVTSRRAFGIGNFGGHVFLTRKEAEEQLELLKVMYF